MVAPTSPTSAPSATGRMAAVQDMARLQRVLFEVEREFVRTATTLIYRVGEPELKYLLCQHVWESAGHARFLRERGRELSGFGTGESVRPELRSLFTEAVMPADGYVALAGFYRVLKPALLAAYRHYLSATHHLADWPSRKLVEEFIADEERHAREMEPCLGTVDATAWIAHLRHALAAHGGLFGDQPRSPLPTGFAWESSGRPYAHPATCNRGKYPTCSSVFSQDPDETPIVRSWLVDPKTDARVIRLMVYVWLMMELDAVDYLATIFIDTPDAPFDLHHDMARHLWDESRHSQFGYRQLPKLGVDLMTLEHSLDLYNILVQMPPHERYAMMTMEFEAGSFPTKALVMDRVRELNDFEADTLLAFDRNDEQNHVRYGHRWLPEIMTLCGDPRPVEEFVKATQARFTEVAKVHGNRTPHALPPERRLTGNKILQLAGVV
ncbi:MAG: ferritin-like domain-containing protein [bacterium]|nr:ferritin-like domain-containing protein [bacterium]MDI1336885.1 ferritin-like domain-containing protein [Lacunisphaera sp.]